MISIVSNEYIIAMGESKEFSDTPCAVCFAPVSRVGLVGVYDS